MKNISGKRTTAWLNESEWLNVFHSVIQSCIHSFNLVLVYPTAFWWALLDYGSTFRDGFPKFASANLVQTCILQ